MSSMKGSSLSNKSKSTRSNATTTSSPSTGAECEYGFTKTNGTLRSLLIHPMGIGLASLLNDLSPPAVRPDFPDAVKNLFLYKDCECKEECTCRDGVFESAVMEWNGRNETDLTTKISTSINERIKYKRIDGFAESDTNGNSLIFESEKAIANGKGKPYFIISKRSNSNQQSNNKAVVMIIKFGIGHDIWWQKQYQMLQYVKLLLAQDENENHAYVFDQPILLTVITVNKRSDSNPIIDVRYGVFLCNRKNEQDYRIALLWRRNEAASLKDASKQFGKILYAAHVCTSLREDKALLNLYRYLGPNCCKFGDLVYRCYDNRLRYTERRPDVYENCTVIKDTKVVMSIPDEGHTDVVMNISDPGPGPGRILSFGEKLPCSDIKDIDWLWEFRGQLKVISTPYHEGIHFANHPNQFLPIIDHLKQLHESGYVHGDIRAYNMVLNYSNSAEPKGHLIDFDFGGLIGKPPAYPSGYVQSLDDGFRRGEPGKDITAADDWYALGDVIMNRHCLKYADISSVKDAAANLSFTLPEKFDKSVLNDDSFSLEHPVAILQEYISLATDNNFFFEFERGFNLSLKECELLAQGNSQQTDTRGATGSPPKKP